MPRVPRISAKGTEKFKNSLSALLPPHSTTISLTLFLLNPLLSPLILNDWHLKLGINFTFVFAPSSTLDFNGAGQLIFRLQ